MIAFLALSFRFTMAKLICALIVVVLLGIMFHSCVMSFSFGFRARAGRGLQRSKIYDLSTFHSNNEGADDYHEATGINYNGANDRNEVADENNEAIDYGRQQSAPTI